MFLKWLVKELNGVLTLWVFFTILILIDIPVFFINDYISSPQHGRFEHFAAVSQIIRDSGHLWSYRLFFVFDFFWAIYLLMIIANLVRDKEGHLLIDQKASRTLASVIFSYAFGLAWLLDICEGVWYWFFWSAGLSAITYAKYFAYAICFSFLIYWFFKTQFFPNIKRILRFISTCLLSILFILIVYALVTVMPQGRTIVVDLFYHPVNILIFFFLLSFLAILLSHYPVYVDIWLNGSDQCVKLNMDPRSRLLGVGLIYYDTLSNSPLYEAYNDSLVKKFRRSLGILLYVAVFNIFIGVAANIFEAHINSAAIAALIFVITVFIYNLAGQKYIDWKEALYNYDDPQKQKATVDEIIRYVTRFPKYLGICLGAAVVTAVVAALDTWSRAALWCFLITLGLQMFLYIQFKIARTYLKYVYYSTGLFNSNPDMFDAKTLKIFGELDDDHEHKRGEGWLNFNLGRLSDNIQYLKIMRFIGLVSLVVLVAANSRFQIASSINPINIILLYIIFSYSFLTILFKHILYYHRLKDISTPGIYFFRYGLPLLMVIIFALATFFGKQGNDLHELSLVRQKQKPLDHTAFLSGMLADGKKNYFFLGSYGGGLKANLWNLLLLNKLQNASDNRFFKRTIAMSGVSGGAVGIGNFTALLREQPQQRIPAQIDSIGLSNVLSNELTYLLGRDLIREFWPYSGNKDRAYRSMAVHAHNTGMKGFDSVAFSDYWRGVYDQFDHLFPALIMNSTAVGGVQGVASTVAFPDDCFPGAIRMDRFDSVYSDSTYTLTYYGAISTTNRFPLFSPTAKIDTKGSFLDGGYFENSGMLSLLGIYDALSTDSVHHYRNRIQPVYINVINSEDYYIAAKLREWHVEPQELKESGELASIISTVASIDKLPGYVNKKILARGYALEEIMMPHKITYEQVRSILKADVKDPIALMEKIRKNNDRIDSVLMSYGDYKFSKWGVVQPPLARLLSEPAVRYQEAMVNGHPEVLDAINRILKYLDTTEKVDKDYQKNLMRKVSRYK